MDFSGKEKSEIAKELKIYLREKVMPYWYDTTIDSTKGGYTLADKLYTSRNVGNPWWTRLCLLLSSNFQKSTIRAKERQLVSQSRMLLVFSLAHRLGYSEGKRNYLKAAEVGYRFLIESMLDKEHGGFYWKTDLKGRVLDSGKSLYGQAFALYALVEYHRASGLSSPLDQAIALYQKVQEKFHDEINFGWIEHGEQDFSPLNSLSCQPTWAIRGMPGVIGFKSSNAHLHWMEALIELYEVTFNASVKTSLMETLHINKTFFFPANAAKSCDYRMADWSKVRDNRHDSISYGHNIEFAWLMIRAQKVLQVPLDWNHFDNILMYTLKYGFDYKKGGFYSKGFGEQPASETEKIWWVQAEGIASLSEALHHKANVDYDRALDLLLSWIFKYQILSDDGIWIWSTDREGTPMDLTKACSWKAAYHEVRAIIKFIHMFSTSKNNYVS